MWELGALWDEKEEHHGASMSLFSTSREKPPLWGTRSAARCPQPAPLPLTRQALLHQLLQWQSDRVMLHVRCDNVWCPPAVPRRGLAVVEVPASGVDHHVVCLKAGRQRGKRNPIGNTTPFEPALLITTCEEVAGRGSIGVAPTSVPPEVKTMSSGRPPTILATLSRALPICSFAFVPAGCDVAALP